MKILFIEDEIDARYGLTPLLRSMGHIVDEVGDADEAIKRLQETAYDLLLLDVMLIGSSSKLLVDVLFHEQGKELLVRLRDNQLGPLKTRADVPVVVITAAADTTIVRVLNGKAAIVLNKPIDPDVMVAKMRGLLETPKS